MVTAKKLTTAINHMYKADGVIPMIGEEFMTMLSTRPQYFGYHSAVIRIISHMQRMPEVFSAPGSDILAGCKTPLVLGTGVYSTTCQHVNSAYTC